MDMEQKGSNVIPGIAFSEDRVDSKFTSATRRVKAVPIAS
jgi:hypothetical protein